MGAISFKSLKVYQIAFQLALDLYCISKEFPSEEKFALTDQLRRSSEIGRILNHMLKNPEKYR